MVFYFLYILFTVTEIKVYSDIFYILLCEAATPFYEAGYSAFMKLAF